MGIMALKLASAICLLLVVPSCLGAVRHYELERGGTEILSIGSDWGGPQKVWFLVNFTIKNTDIRAHTPFIDAEIVMTDGRIYEWDSMYYIQPGGHWFNENILGYSESGWVSYPTLDPWESFLAAAMFKIPNGTVPDAGSVTAFM